MSILPYIATFACSGDAEDGHDRDEVVEVYAASEEEALARARTFTLHTRLKREVTVRPPAAVEGRRHATAAAHRVSTGGASSA